MQPRQDILLPSTPGKLSPRFHQQLAAMARQAREQGLETATLVYRAAILALHFGWMLFSVSLAWFVLGPATQSLTFYIPKILLLLATVAYGFVVVTAIRVMLALGQLYQRHYNDVRRDLRSTDLGLMITQQEYWEQLKRQAMNALPLKIGGRRQYRSLTEHLSFCAYHLQSLRLLVRGRERSPLLMLFAGQLALSTERFYQKPMWVYWLWMVLAIVLAPVGVLGMGLFTWLGRRFIISRAALAAFCDHLCADADTSPPQLS